MPLTIVAHIHAKAEARDTVREALLALIPTTRAEAGCRLYDLHEDDADPAHFMFYETWESRELWQDHMNAPHLQAYVAATEGLVERFEVFEMHAIG